MKEVDFEDFSKNFEQKLKNRIPLDGQLELTYRCGFNCIHCYCAAYNRAENKKRELSFAQWKGILDQIHRLGGIYLTLTGGDPLLHEDFIKIYDYAVRRGFLVTVFTSGVLLDRPLIQHFQNLKPFSIEITLNSITPQTYTAITGTKGAFERVLRVIRQVKSAGLPLVLKTNGMKENRHAILKIKNFVITLLGKGKYKFDPLILAGLDGSLSPTTHRLHPKEIVAIEASDPDMRAQICEQRKQARPPWGEKELLYHCNAWMRSYFINPYGLLQFCHLSRKFSTDLTKETFKKGFYQVFPRLLKETYHSKSKCINCRYKEVCYHCPARAYLETGSEEAPVKYFCQLARAQKEAR